MSTRRAALPLLAALTLPFLLGNEDEGGSSGCGGEGEDDGGELELGPPTETVCPEGSTLTYENFGAAFMESYCQRCHSADVSGADRQGAPDDHNFDSQIEAQGLAEHIDKMAGAGPAATNEIMPVGEPKPTLEERQQLAEWLACGAL